jgi:phosphoserine phosphatase
MVSMISKGPYLSAGYHNKDLALKELVAKHNATFDGSYAVGDSFSDSKMMEIVNNPIAFNPDKELLSVAKKKGWKIVVERKNVIYELEEGNGGTYILV